MVDSNETTWLIPAVVSRTQLPTQIAVKVQRVRALLCHFKGTTVGTEVVAEPLHLPLNIRTT
jgi:hypothetical protein